MALGRIATDERSPERPPEPPPPSAGSRRSPDTDWPPWSALLALVGGLVLAAVGAFVVVELPALALGFNLTHSSKSPGLAIADTVVQDVAFVLVAVYFAQLGGRAVRSWQFGLRRPSGGWWAAVRLMALLLVVFVVLSVIWSEVLNPPKEKLLDQLGTNKSTLLLLLSAALTCIVAPICEEMLFRGYIFTALRNWRGTLPAALITAVLFGGVHVGSAPALDLIPLAGLGFGLCLLYRYTGSLYPGIAVHALNNSIAFAGLKNWTWQMPVLMACSLLGIGAVVMAFKRAGVIEGAAA